jgi:hypothetical protein
MMSKYFVADDCKVVDNDVKVYEIFLIEDITDVLTRRYNATSCCLFARRLLLAGLEPAGLPLKFNNKIFFD